MKPEEQANVLRIRDKSVCLKSPLLEVLAARKKKDLTKLMEGVVTRHRQLKRVAIMYKEIYDELRPSIRVPPEQSSKTAEYIRGEHFKEFHKRGIELGGLSANSEPNAPKLTLSNSPRLRCHILAQYSGYLVIEFTATQWDSICTYGYC